MELTNIKFKLLYCCATQRFTMKRISTYQASILTIFIIVIIVLFLTRCIDHGKNETVAIAIKNDSYKKFAGSASCKTCHKNIYDTHIHTAHYLTTHAAAKQYIIGSFENDSNKFAYNDKNLVAMEQRDSGFYQVAYINGIEKAARRIDIVIGSGVMGQSFLNWQINSLFQLPITYFSAAKQWSNSPGYPNKIIFNRPVSSRCLECHSTFANVTSALDVEPEQFDRTQMILGVDCEKCHGPAAEHVAFQTQNPTVTTAKFITNPARLSRQQNLDLCASCHGGRLIKTRPSFEFTVGDTLSHFFKQDTTIPNADNIDVHGNQYGLLRASKCFRMSETMTCNTCHNTHENERGKSALYIQRCMTCHNKEHETFCKLTPSAGDIIKKHCIECHMPLKPSRAIAVFLPGGSAPTAALIRSHFISTYPEETKKVLHYIKKN